MKNEQARVGDMVIAGAHQTGGSRRIGEIVEILGEGERAHYRVRWEDGHESILYPALGDVTIQPRRRGAAKPTEDEPVLLHEP